jgi:hypothetical protein
LDAPLVAVGWKSVILLALLGELRMNELLILGSSKWLGKNSLLQKAGSSMFVPLFGTAEAIIKYDIISSCFFRDCFEKRKSKQA